MTLFESPMLVIAIGSTTAALLGGLWLQTGKRVLLVLLVGVLALTATGVILERSVETDRFGSRPSIFIELQLKVVLEWECVTTG